MNDTNKQNAPLPDRMRPESIEDIVGQESITGEESPIFKALKNNYLPSMILWGPSGCGKTTIARILAKYINAEFLTLNAVTSGLKEFRSIINHSLENKIEGKKTVLFIDEIHRWNKKQQDALLHYIEDGTIIFIGATTENPSFEVINALLSRVNVVVLNPLSKDDVIFLIKKALKDKKRGLGNINVKIKEEEINMIAEFSCGDARVALNALELCVNSVLNNDSANLVITKDIIKNVFQKTRILYDKQGDEHYNLISAFIKSLRGSDADAAVYYLARMIEGGEKPEFIARRMLIFASEDIGNALPTALVVANSCFDAVLKIGWPESKFILSQTAIYLAKAPKSNLSKRAIDNAISEVRSSGSLPVPLHLRNASTKFMKNLGYGDGYIYTPDNPNAKQEFLPKKIKGKKFVK